MARVILGWELGAGYGHVAMLVPLARALYDIGHTPILVLKDTSVLPKDFDADRIRVVKLPAWPAFQGEPRHVDAETLGDPLLSLGFGSADHLERLAALWDPLLADIRPDVAVIDFAPVLSMVLRGRIPVVAIGTGYSVPPLGRRLGPIRPWVERLSDAAEARQDRILDALARVAARRGGRPAQVADLFTGDAAAVCTIALLDPYNRRRGARPLGPLNIPRTVERRPAAPAYGFAYLAGDAANLPNILEGLRTSPLPFQAFVRHIHPDLRRRFEGSALRLHDTPQDLVAHMGRAAVVVHHGGMSTTHEALWTGTPQLLVPKTLEQTITTRAITSAGLGTGISASVVKEPGQLAPLVDRVAGSDAIQRRAAGFSADFRAACPYGAMGPVLSMIDTLADGGRLQGGQA